jgi:SOS-response transcriptional repressor LexA
MSNLSIGRHWGSKNTRTPTIQWKKMRSSEAVERQDLKILKERVAERIEALETNARAVSKKAGLGETAIHDILSGKNQKPSVPHLQAIARALKCQVAFLIGESDDVGNGENRRRTLPIRIAGLAEAGNFRVMRDFGADRDSDLPELDAAASRYYPKAKHFALEVRGDSMNAARPTSIVEGMYALCVDMIDAELVIESGRIYAVRRTLDGGQTYECTLKRAKVFRDRIELHPESTNPRHVPLIIPAGVDYLRSHEVEAIGLVYGLYSDLEPKAG